MRTLIIALAVSSACALAGCSVFFNPDDLVGGDGAVDSGLDTSIDGDTSVDTMSDALPPDTSFDGGRDGSVPVVSFCRADAEWASVLIEGDLQNQALSLAAGLELGDWVASVGVVDDGGPVVHRYGRDGLIFTTAIEDANLPDNLVSLVVRPAVTGVAVLGLGTSSAVAASGIYVGTINAAGTLAGFTASSDEPTQGMLPGAISGSSALAGRRMYRETSDAGDVYGSLLATDPEDGGQEFLTEDVPSDSGTERWGTGSEGELALLDDMDQDNDTMLLWDGVDTVHVLDAVSDALYESDVVLLGGDDDLRQYAVLHASEPITSNEYEVRLLDSAVACDGGDEPCIVKNINEGEATLYGRSRTREVMVAGAHVPGVGAARVLAEADTDDEWSFSLAFLDAGGREVAAQEDLALDLPGAYALDVAVTGANGQVYVLLAVGASNGMDGLQITLHVWSGTLSGFCP